MSKVIALIPARGGSKGIPRKNIKMLGGKPLIKWVLTAASHSRYIQHTYLATDDKEIAAVVKSFNLPKTHIYDRDPRNATDTSSTENLMLEFLQVQGSSNSRVDLHADDIIVLIQPTSPFLTTQHLNEALAEYTNNPEIDSMLSVVSFRRFLWDKSGQPLNYDYRTRPRRQDFQGELLENGAFYINRVRNILKFKNRLSGKIKPYTMPEHTALELDEPSDWTLAEALISSGTT